MNSAQWITVVLCSVLYFVEASCHMLKQIPCHHHCQLQATFFFSLYNCCFILRSSPQEVYSPKRMIHVEMKNQIKKKNTVNAISNKFSLSIQLFQKTNLWGNSKHLKSTSFSRNKTTIWPSNLTIRHITWGNQNGKRYMYPNVRASLVAQLVKKSACNAGDLGPIPGLGRSHGEGKGYPLQYSGLWKSRTTERLSLSPQCSLQHYLQ